MVSAGRLAHTWPPPLGHPPGPDILPLQAFLSSWQSGKQSSDHRESSKRAVDEGLVVDEGRKVFVAGGLPLKVKHADGLAEAEFTLKNLPKDLSVHSYS